MVVALSINICISSCTRTMSSKRLYSTVQSSYQIPPIIRNSLFFPGNGSTEQNPPPFQPKKSSILATNIIKSYFEKGLIREAHSLFDEMPDRDIVAWTAMITGYSACDHHDRSWVVFRNMMRECEDKPNAYTLSSILKACKGARAITWGGLVHGLAIRLGLNEDAYVGNSLLDMYVTCGETMEEARLVFREIGVKNSVAWTMLITGYTHRGKGYKGLRLFKKMLSEQGEASPFCFTIVARASASIGSDACGKQIHASVIKHGFDSNIPIMNSIIDMYCRCSCLSEANDCFNAMSEKNLITWNTIISGYEKSNSIESFYIFSQMKREGFIPNGFTYSSVVAGCANLAVFSCGQQVHGGIICRGFGDYMAITNSLIDMYAKCGNMLDARKIFSRMLIKDLVSWTSMMIGYGSHGYGKEAVELFDEMVKTGVKLDKIVFIAILGACSHGGLVDEGLEYFKSMICDHKIKPNQEIYGCVVDLLGRAGRVNEAYEIIESMPFKPDESIWGAYLGACKAHRVPNLAKLVVGKVLDTRPDMTSTYVMLSNIYASEGKWGESAELRKMMKVMGRKKEAGTSWIEVRNRVSSFASGDKMRLETEGVNQVFAMLVQHIKEEAYVFEFDCLTHDMEDGT